MTLLFSLFLACKGDSSSGFSTSGNASVNPDSITGSTDGGSSGSSNDENSVNPVVSGMDGSFVSDTDGTMLEMHIYVEDPQDDLLNGFLEIDYQWGDSADSAQMDIDGENVLVEAGELTFFIPDVDDTYTYEVFVTVYDEASNPSEQSSTEVLPAE
jgi:hypothetical protein